MLLQMGYASIIFYGSGLTPLQNFYRLVWTVDIWYGRTAREDLLHKMLLLLRLRRPTTGAAIAAIEAHFQQSSFVLHVF